MGQSQTNFTYSFTLQVNLFLFILQQRMFFDNGNHGLKSYMSPKKCALNYGINRIRTPTYNIMHAKEEKGQQLVIVNLTSVTAWLHAQKVYTI